MKSTNLRGSKMLLLEQVLFIMKNNGACNAGGKGLSCNLCLIYPKMGQCQHHQKDSHPADIFFRKKEHAPDVYAKAKEILENKFTPADIVEILV